MHIPIEMLAAETLRSLIEHVVTREGTDYGEVEYTLEQKIEQVLGQLRRGEALVVFDADSESCTIIPS